MITADMVKKLRDATGAGMMDCKRALAAADGDFDTAVDNLRKSGIAKAEKKAARATKDGKITSLIEGTAGAMIEVLCETDFVAKTDKFNAFIADVAAKTLAMDADGCVSEAVQAAENDQLVALIGVIGENMQIRRCARWSNPNGKIGSYLHMGGKIGVMVDIEGPADDQLVNEICLHVTAFNPPYINSSDIPAATIEHEKEIAAAQLTGKPANMIEKIVGGKINKWFTEVCLMNQPWVMDDKTTLAKLHPNVKVKRIIRWQIGEEA